MSNQSLYTAAQVRELDRIVIEKFGISGYELMQRAGSLHITYVMKLFQMLKKFMYFADVGIMRATVMF